MSEWMELMEWVTIRGPVGDARRDYHTAFLARYGGRQWHEDTTVEQVLALLMSEMPYVKPVVEEE